MLKDRRVPSIINRRSRKIAKITSEQIDEENEYDSLIDLTDNPLSCAYCDKVYSHTKARNKHMINEHLEQW